MFLLLILCGIHTLITCYETNSTDSSNVDAQTLFPRVTNYTERRNALIKLRNVLGTGNYTYNDSQHFGSEMIALLYPKTQLLKVGISTDDIICHCTSFNCRYNDLHTLLGSEFANLCRLPKGSGSCYVTEQIDYNDNRRKFDYGCYTYKNKPSGELRDDSSNSLFCLNFKYIGVHCCKDHMCNLRKDLIPVHPTEPLPPSVSYTRWEKLLIAVGVLSIVFVVSICLLCLLKNFVHLKDWFARSSKKKSMSSTDDAHPMIASSADYPHPDNFAIAGIVPQNGLSSQEATFSDSNSGRKAPVAREVVRETKKDKKRGITPRDLIEGLESATFSTGGSGIGISSLAPRTIARQLYPMEKIGEGRFGEVWLCEWKCDKVAAKICSSRDERAWHREKSMFESYMLRHHNIVTYKGADMKDVGSTIMLYLVIEYHPNGSLYDYLSKNALSEIEFLYMIKGIANGLAFLHTEVPGPRVKPAIAHRDLKTKNILVRRDLSCVIADLGLAVKYENGKIDVPPNNKCGTVRYMAPEVLNDDMQVGRIEAHKQSDVYQLALIMWEALQRTGGPLCHAREFDEALAYGKDVPRDPSVEEMRRVVALEGVRPPIQADWDVKIGADGKKLPRMRHEMCRMLRECWNPNPNARLSAFNVRLSIERVAEEDGLVLPADFS